MTDELKPCPFCGSVPELLDGGSVTAIRCSSDQCISRPEPFNDWGHRESAIAAWNRRAQPAVKTAADAYCDLHCADEHVRGCVRHEAAQPEPAAPTPDTFMGEPVLTRWKPLNRDDSRLALHQSMHNRSFGNPSDDKLMLEWLWKNGYALCKRVPEAAAPTTLNENEADPCVLWAEIARLRAAVAGPKGFATWQDAATDERVRRVRAERALAAAPTVVEPSRWEGGEGWESLAWDLCAEENGEDACNELIWEGGPIPEPWGDRWMKYEGEAKRLIALVHKHAATPPRAALTELQRMQIIGDEFPLALVDPLVIAKVDAVCLAIEAAHGIGRAAQ